MDNQQATVLLKQITFNPEIFNGKPIIRDMRFRVSDVLELFANGLFHAQILEEHPMLQAEDLAACLLYATMIVSDSKSAELHAA